MITVTKTFLPPIEEYNAQIAQNMGKPVVGQIEAPWQLN